jgi:hypothetical protein
LSHPASGSYEWIEARMVLTSMPDLPPPVLAVMKASSSVRNDYPERQDGRAKKFPRFTCIKQRMLSACSAQVGTDESSSRLLARAIPFLRALCCTTAVQNEEEEISSHRSNLRNSCQSVHITSLALVTDVVWFQLSCI